MLNFLIELMKIARRKVRRTDRKIKLFHHIFSLTKIFQVENNYKDEETKCKMSKKRNVNKKNNFFILLSDFSHKKLAN